MENTINMLSPEETDELRKSLTDLGMEEDEISEYIEKAKKSVEGEPEHEEGETPAEEKKEAKEKPAEEAAESASEPTIADKAGEGKEKQTEEEAKEETEEKVEKGMGEEDLEKACNKLKAQKADLEKSIEDMELKMGKNKVEKSVEDDLGQSPVFDIEKAFGESLASLEDDIRKSLAEEFNTEFDDIKKSLTDMAAEVKKIGDTPFGMKSVITKANFFEKSLASDEDAPDMKNMSISRDRDDILKGMSDMLNTEQDPTWKQVLEDGISDFTVNAKPTNHGAKAIAYFSKKNNINLEA